MKTSTTASPKPTQCKSILLVGPPGGGKTTLALQFPNLLILDCDLNLDGPERFLRRDCKLDLTYDYDCVPLQDNGQPRPVEKCYDYLLDQLRPEKVTTYKWVVIDSLSQVNEFIIRKILAEQRVTEMSARNWQPFKTYALELLIGKLRHLGTNVLVTAHEVKITKPAGPNAVMQEIVVGYEPFFQGKVGEMLGGFFTDMWRCTAQAAPAGKVDYLLETNRSALSDLKNSLGLPNVIKNPTYKDLEKYFV